MGLGVPELIAMVTFAVLGLLPFVVTVWAVLTLREVQRSQRAIEGRLETIERLLREH